MNECISESNCDLGKIYNCDFYFYLFILFYLFNFFFFLGLILRFDLRFQICKVKLQLNIVNNVQHSTSIVTLLKNNNTIETITEILIVSIKTITKFLFVLGIIPKGITVILLVAIC